MSAYGWAIVAACVWGIVPLLEKTGLGQSNPAAGVWVRSLGVVLGVLVFGFAWRPWRHLEGLPPSRMALLMLGGLLASFIGQMAFYQALKRGSVSQVTPVAGAYPLISVILGWIILREPVTFTRFIGAACIVAGLIFLRR